MVLKLEEIWSLERIAKKEHLRYQSRHQPETIREVLDYLIEGFTSSDGSDLTNDYRRNMAVKEICKQLNYMKRRSRSKKFYNSYKVKYEEKK